MATEILEKTGATAEDILREVSRIKTVVYDAVEEGVETAVRAIKHGRDAAEDVIDDARRAMKKKPLQAAGIIFAAGIVTGTLLAWMGSRRR